MLPVTSSPLRENRISPARYVGPADLHLLVTADRRIHLSDAAPVKFCRPAADRLFLSAAATYRERALGVVLTGCNTDGALGVQAIKWLGGRVLVQDPDTCRAGGMPRAAIATGQVDFALPIERIAAALVAMVMVPGAAEFFRVCPSAA
jgi:two-component system chemotaxis response regulator CheB